MMRFLVVGRRSIGQRHRFNLGAVGHGAPGVRALPSLPHELADKSRGALVRTPPASAHQFMP